MEIAETRKETRFVYEGQQENIQSMVEIMSFGLPSSRKLRGNNMPLLKIDAVNIESRTSGCNIVEILAPSAQSVFNQYSFPVEFYLRTDKPVGAVRFNVHGELQDEVKPAGSQQESKGWLTHIKCEISVLGLREAFCVVIVAMMEGDTNFRLGQITGTRKRMAIADKSPAFQPVCVNGIPRSGTTFLMGLLSAHPEMITKDSYPFEHRPALYWAHMFQALSRPNNTVGGLWNWSFESERDRIGPFTYHPGIQEIDAWVAKDYIDSLGAFCVRSIDEAYAIMSNAAHKVQAHCFLEKFPGWKGKYFSELYSSYQEVIIIRDIRDVFCSVKSFNKRRGNEDFGVDRHDDDKSYLRSLGALLRRMCSKKSADDGRIRHHFIRYEDLIVSPVSVVSELYKALGLRVDDEVVAILDAALSSNNLNVSTHRTGSVDNGVERWRIDLPRSLNDFAFDEFGDLLSSLGYEKG